MKKLYTVFATDTNAYTPFAMWVHDGGMLTIDIYQGQRPIGRVDISVDNDMLTIDTSGPVPARSEYPEEVE